MKLDYAVLYLGDQRLEVVASGGDEKRRKIDVQWRAKEATDIPPENWPQQVEAEAEYQRAEEFQRARGVFR